MKIKIPTKSKPILHHPENWQSWETEYQKSQYEKPNQRTLIGLLLVIAMVAIVFTTLLFTH